MSKRPVLSPVTLVGSHVRLEPLELDHVDELAAAAAVDRANYGWTSVPDGRPAMERYVAGLLTDREAGEVLPFVQRSATTGAALGCTRYLEPRWFAGRSAPDEIEVGGTWLTAPAQRTAVNTEAKLLLFRHAFEEYAVWRLSLATDADNVRSRNAIERAGATFEGILRNHRMRAGDQFGAAPPAPRDTAMFSITRDEWPRARDSLLAKLSSR